MKTMKIAEKEFAEWAELARSDADSFENQRQAAIDEFINSVPQEHRERLRRLQWRIDQERRLARTPMAACLKLSRMMWKNVLGAGGLRDRFEELGGILQAGPVARRRAPQMPPEAEVVAFARD